MFLLVPAYPGCPGSKAVKRSLSLLPKVIAWSSSEILLEAYQHSKKGKGSPYSIAEHRVPELIPVLGSQPAGDASHKPGAVDLQVTQVINPAAGCHYFPPGPQLPPQPLRELLPVSLPGEQALLH